ncbi:MAG: hypothetical protein IPI07_18480 [Flavobacteriales bacterium]|nr:hypothetical protein [Flavobacteriales bacterium]
MLETWVSRASFPGAKRTGAVALHHRYYRLRGHGSSTTGALNDLWAYDPAANSWTQRAALPAVPRTRASAFTIASLRTSSGASMGRPTAERPMGP